jgi:hypothetical protein
MDPLLLMVALAKVLPFRYLSPTYLELPSFLLPTLSLPFWLVGIFDSYQHCSRQKEPTAAMEQRGFVYVTDLLQGRLEDNFTSLGLNLVKNWNECVWGSHPQSTSKTQYCLYIMLCCNRHRIINFSVTLK